MNLDTTVGKVGSKPQNHNMAGLCLAMNYA
jgi:hypothetical protein